MAMNKALKAAAVAVPITALANFSCMAVKNWNDVHLEGMQV
jgi:hypothetical protein